MRAVSALLKLILVDMLTDIPGVKMLQLNHNPFPLHVQNEPKCSKNRTPSAIFASTGHLKFECQSFGAVGVRLSKGSHLSTHTLFYQNQADASECKETRLFLSCLVASGESHPLEWAAFHDFVNHTLNGICKLPMADPLSPLMLFHAIY